MKKIGIGILICIKIPQFEMVNPNMNLSEFKIIFFGNIFIEF